MPKKKMNRTDREKSAPNARDMTLKSLPNANGETTSPPELLTHTNDPSPERITCLLLDAPIGPWSPPEEINAWLLELDELETEVEPGSDAVETIESAREEAHYYLAFQAKVIADGGTMQYAPAKRRPAR